MHPSLHEKPPDVVVILDPPTHEEVETSPRDVVVDPLRPLSPEEVTAVARRLAALLLACHGAAF